MAIDPRYLTRAASWQAIAGHLFGLLSPDEGGTRLGLTADEFLELVRLAHWSMVRTRVDAGGGGLQGPHRGR